MGMLHAGTAGCPVMIGLFLIVDRVRCCARPDHRKMLTRLRPLSLFWKNSPRDTSASVLPVLPLAGQLLFSGAVRPALNLQAIPPSRSRPSPFLAEGACFGRDAAARRLHFPYPQTAVSLLICARHEAEPRASFRDPRTHCSMHRGTVGQASHHASAFLY
jgi:hypothetical protein